MKRSVMTGLATLACILLGCSRNDRQLLQNKDVVRRVHDRVFSQGDLSAVDELYSADFVCHFLVGPEWRGREGVKEHVTGLRRAFPDWHEDIEDIIAEGDRVVTRFRSSGTHRGEFQGIAPTERRVTVPEVAIFRLANGQIAEQWGFPDIAGLLRQLQPEDRAGRPE